MANRRTQQQSFTLPKTVAELHQSWDGLIHKSIKAYVDDEHLLKDAKQDFYMKCLRLGLLDRYNPNRGVTFTAYLAQCARNSARSFLVRLSRDRIRWAEPLAELLFDDDEGGYYRLEAAQIESQYAYEGRVPEHETSVIQTELRELFTSVFEVLEETNSEGRFDTLSVNPLEVFVFFREGWSAVEIAKEKGVHPNLVYRCRRYLKLLVESILDEVEPLSYDDFVVEVRG